MRLSQNANPFRSEKVIWASLLLILTIWSYFSYNNWISDSEYWPISLSGHWDLWRQQPALIYKPLFHLSLSWIYLFDLDSVQHLHVAKAFYTFLGVLSFVFFFLILRRQLKSLKALLVTFIFLFSNLGFSQVGVIRSDFLSFFITLLYFYWIPKVKSQSWIQVSIYTAFFSLLLILCTPKSIFFCILIFIYSFFKLEKGIHRFRFFLVCGWLSIIATYLMSLWLGSGEMMNAFLSALQFARDSYRDPKVVGFFSEYMSRYTLHDILIWMLFIIGFVYQLILFKRKKQLEALAYEVIILFIFLFYMIHHPATAFFVGSYFGLLFLAQCYFWRRIPEFILLGVLVANIAILCWNLKPLYYYSNKIEFETVRKISDFVKGSIPQGKIFDGLAVGPRDSYMLHYVGPDDESAHSQIIEAIKTERPELVSYSSRVALLEPAIGEILRESYKPIGIGYWLRKDIQTKEYLNLAWPPFFVFVYEPYPSHLGEKK